MAGGWRGAGVGVKIMGMVGAAEGEGADGLRGGGVMDCSDHGDRRPRPRPPLPVVIIMLGMSPLQF